MPWISRNEWESVHARIDGLERAAERGREAREALGAQVDQLAAEVGARPFCLDDLRCRIAGVPPAAPLSLREQLAALTAHLGVRIVRRPGTPASAVVEAVAPAADADEARARLGLPPRAKAKR